MLPRPEINFQRTPVTLIIAAVAVALEIVCTLQPEMREYYHRDLHLGLLSTIWSGEVWRPLTASMLHAGIFHAAFNAYCLVIFGSVLEPYFGSYRYLGLLILLGYVSMMPEFLVDNWNAPLDAQRTAVGLSGVGYGLFGLLWAARRWRADFAYVCNDDTVRLLVGWFFLCIVMTYYKVMPVANVAHGAGLLFGFVYGRALFGPHGRLPWIAGGVVATLLVLATLVAAPGHPLYQKYRANEQLRKMLHEFRQVQHQENDRRSDFPV
jgi:membrane associated rhomboid family serine protease